MNKKLSLALLLCIPTIYGMESAQNTYDVMKHVFAYTMWLESSSNDHNQNGLWQTIRRNHRMQYVSKNFRAIFWHYFKTDRRFTLEEKDEFIRTLLRKWNQGDSHTTFPIVSPIPPIPDIAIRLGASLYPILRSSVSSIFINRTCNPEFVRTILDAENSGKIINQPNSWDYTPLMSAIVHKHIHNYFKVVKLLLTHPDIQVNPIHGQMCPLFWATFHRDIKVIKLLLAHPDIQVNGIDNYFKGETALFAAVRASWSDINEFHSIITLLLDAGIDSSIKNTEGQTALDVARSHAYTADRAEVLELVLAMRK